MTRGRRRRRRRTPTALISEVVGEIGEWGLDDLPLVAEPGRVIAARSFSLIVRVLLKKGRRIYINDGIWASLSDSWTGKITLPARLLPDPARRKRTGSTRTRRVQGLRRDLRFGGHPVATLLPAADMSIPGTGSRSGISAPIRWRSAPGSTASTRTPSSRCGLPLPTQGRRRALPRWRPWRTETMTATSATAAQMTRAGGLRTGTIAAISVAVGLAVLGIKLLAWQLTGSVALFSDALESIVNVAASTAALLAINYSARPADANHPYGHHKAEYFSVVLEGVLIIVAAIIILREAYQGVPLAAHVRGAGRGPGGQRRRLGDQRRLELVPDPRGAEAPLAGAGRRRQAPPHRRRHLRRRRRRPGRRLSHRHRRSSTRSSPRSSRSTSCGRAGASSASRSAA